MTPMAETRLRTTAESLLGYSPSAVPGDIQLVAAAILDFLDAGNAPAANILVSQLAKRPTVQADDGI